MLTREQKITLVERSSHEGLGEDRGGEVILSEHWVQTIVPGVRSFVANRVYRSVLDADEVDARIAATVAMYQARGLPLQWLVGPGARPLDLGERLLATGFRLATTAAGLFARLEEIRPGLGQDVTVEATDERTLGDWVTIQAAGWHMPLTQAERLRAQSLRRLRSARERTLYAVGRIAGAPAGAASVDLHDGFAYLRNLVVLPEHRRKGVLRALLADLLVRLKARDMPYITAHAIEDTSAPILEAMGFERVCEIRYYDKSA